MSDQEEFPEITITFRGADQVKRHARSPWVNGKRLKDYLKSPFFSKYGLLMLAIKGRLRDQNSRIMRINYPLNAGDQVFIIKQGRTEV